MSVEAGGSGGGVTVRCVRCREVTWEASVPSFVRKESSAKLCRKCQLELAAVVERRLGGG